MNGSSNFNTHLPILEECNWERWSAMMKNLVGEQDLLEIVQNGVTDLDANATEVQRNAHKDLKNKDSKALFLIQQSLDEGNFERISKSTSAKEAWDILAKYHQGFDKVKLIKLQSLRRKFELVQMEEEQKIVEYVSKLINIVNQMNACGEQ
jgi:predicted AlkP superfamily phosphohydrolase/phosphomutase